MLIIFIDRRNLFVIALLLTANVSAVGLPDVFIDPLDKQLDTSSWLLEKKGFLPVPIIITEPAIGYGGGASLVYFHDRVGGQDGKPSVSAFAAGGTENGTWFAGGGHLGIWKDDTIRYIGGLGIGHTEMEYYGLSSRQKSSDSSIHFSGDFLFFIQDLQFRLGDSNFFAGASYTLFDTENTFELVPDSPIFTPRTPSFPSRSAGLSLILSYDSRNNMFSPKQGLASRIKATSINSLWGSDTDYWALTANAMYYKPLSETWMLGTRVDVKAVDGDVPFYAYPFIDMRGIKVMQYQGKQTLLGELELNWQFHPRWTLVGFGGAGKAYNSGYKETNSDMIISKGGGFRYLIARKLGLQMGIDIAQGPDDTALYIQFGSAWALR